VLQRINLTALLALLALLDLLLDRVFTRLFLGERDSASGGARLLAQLGTHISNLCGALALLLFASTFVTLVRRRELFPRALRVVTSLLAVVFVLMLAACVSSVQVPGRWFVQLTTTHAFLVWLTALALWSAPVPIRPKLGVTLFALPAVLHTAALFASQSGQGAGLAGNLARIGELTAFIAAGAAPLLLLPAGRGTRFFGLAWVAGLAAATLVLVGLVLRFDLVQVLALYGLRLDLPALGSPAGWAYALLLALAVLGTFLIVVPAFAAGGSDRLLAYGVLLVVVAGYQASSPADLGVSACGMLAIALGVYRRPTAPAAESGTMAKAA
jgi:hypothetical protein